MSVAVFSVVGVVIMLAIGLYFEGQRRAWFAGAVIGAVAYFVSEVGGEPAVWSFSVAAVIFVAAVDWRSNGRLTVGSTLKATGAVVAGLLVAFFSAALGAAANFLGIYYGRSSGIDPTIDRLVARLCGVSGGVVVMTLLLLPARHLPPADEFFSEANFRGQVEVELTCGGPVPARCLEYVGEAMELKARWQADPAAFHEEFGNDGSISDDECLTQVLASQRRHWNQKRYLGAPAVLASMMGTMGALFSLETTDGAHDFVARNIALEPCLQGPTDMTGLAP